MNSLRELDIINYNKINGESSSKDIFESLTLDISYSELIGG